MQPSLQAPVSVNVTLALPSSALCSITAVSRVPTSMEVWWVGTDASVRCAFWYAPSHPQNKRPRRPQDPGPRRNPSPDKNQLRERPIEGPLLAQSRHELTARGRGRSPSARRTRARWHCAVLLLGRPAGTFACLSR